MIMLYFSISRHLLMVGNLRRGCSLVLVSLVTIKMIYSPANIEKWQTLIITETISFSKHNNYTVISYLEGIMLITKIFFTTELRQVSYK